MSSKKMTFDDLAVMIKRGFQRIGRRFDRIDKRFDEIDIRLDTIIHRLEKRRKKLK